MICAPWWENKKSVRSSSVNLYSQKKRKPSLAKGSESNQTSRSNYQLTEKKRTENSAKLYNKENGIINSTDMSLSKFREILKEREGWCAAVHGAAELYMTWWLNNKKDVKQLKLSPKLLVPNAKWYVRLVCCSPWGCRVIHDLVTEQQEGGEATETLT